MSEREPLTGDAAREALRTTLEKFTTLSEGFRMAVASVLLATGRVLVLPEPEPPCVAKVAAVLIAQADARHNGYLQTPDAYLRRQMLDAARALHAASLCACAADALLRRWMVAHAECTGSEAAYSTRAYLEGR